MKVLFSGYRNPHFVTITEYSEKAFSQLGHEVVFFGDRDYLLPGALRRRLPQAERWDLARLNRRLLDNASACRPDMFFACGGTRVFAGTLDALKGMGVKTVLWTTDPLNADAEALAEAAPHYDRVFCSGSEAVDMLAGLGVSSELLPYACLPELHRPVALSPEELRDLSSEVCFCGTVDPVLYPGRVGLLESLCDMDLKVWGPGADALPAGSPLRRKTAGGHSTPEIWLKAYASAKIVLCMHYSDPSGKYACHQASPRVFEALASGAFLVCDSQRDVAGLFEDGKHLVLFRDRADLRAKVEYYLREPERRAAIAAAGREAVLKSHKYTDRMRRVLESVRVPLP